MSGGCFEFEQVDISDYPAVPNLAGRCVELQQPMFLVERTEASIEAEHIARYMLVRPQESFAPFTVDEYRSGNYQPDTYANVLELVEVGTTFDLDRVWDLKGFEGSVPALTALMEHDERTLTVNVIRILDEMWYLALDKGELHELERQEVAGREVLDAQFARFCDEPEGNPVE